MKQGKALSMAEMHRQPHFILLLVFLLLDTRVTDFTGSEGRKPCSPSFALDEESF